MTSIQSALLSQPLPLSEATTISQRTPNVNPNTPEKAAKDFEGLFTSMLLKEMRSTLQPGSLFAGDSADVYGGLFDQFMGEHISESGNMGLARMIREGIEKTMHKQPEAQPKKSDLAETPALKVN